MLFVIRISEFILFCRLIDDLPISIKEPDAIQESIIRVVVELYLSNVTSNFLECQVFISFQLSLVLFKLEVNLTSIVSMEYAFKLVAISCLLWTLNILSISFRTVRGSSVLMTVGSQLYVAPSSVL